MSLGCFWIESFYLFYFLSFSFLSVLYKSMIQIHPYSRIRGNGINGYLGLDFFRYNLDNTMDGFYIAPAFMDKLVVQITKNFLTLPGIKVCYLNFLKLQTSSVSSMGFMVFPNFWQVPLILGIWGGKGQGKSFQCELVFAKMGIK